MILVCGIDGVGKTYFCKKLIREFGQENFSAGEFILGKEKQKFLHKKIGNIHLISKTLLDEITELKRKNIDFILDGSLCPLDKNGKTERINLNIIKSLDIDLLIVLIDKPAVIKKRLEERSLINWDESLIEYFQAKEIECAKRLGTILDIDYQIRVCDNSNSEKFGQSIVLPIKPVYINKILSGEKRYEYRKTLCKKNIDKIYLYGTSPLKKVVGECKVAAQYTMSKERLWKLTQKHSGIDFSFFDEYYRNEERASAYVLEEAVKYDKPKELFDFGITYTPQSYSYVKTF